MTVPLKLGELPPGAGQIQRHLLKADMLVMDFRNLTPSNQAITMNYIKTLSASQQQKIIIVR